jgi:DNA helicase-2/ATP-dependent DNA helicase PcrA
MPSWDFDLTAEQSFAASYSGTHARLLAGPGTGKTYTLAGRVAYLVSQQNIEPSSILVLTFTRLATRELRARIKKSLAPYSDDMPYIATLHSFALRQLLRNSRSLNSVPQPLRIADDWEEAEIIEIEMRDLLDRRVESIRDSF